MQELQLNREMEQEHGKESILLVHNEDFSEYNLVRDVYKRQDIDRHEAEVFSRIEGTEDVAETESRFSVEETSDAFEPCLLYTSRCV